ncbi:MAG: efflux RND transporter periplasmic adaptor subunit [Pseudomonadales bacterium]|nr:efflux RND transporter periplasmic adaptor subunit [Pseudomonadales bacterium]
MKRILIPIGILTGCLLFAAYLIRTPTQVEESSPEIIPVSVRVTEVQPETVQLLVESHGKVQAAQQVNLSVPVAGPIEWISPSLEAGGYVQAGDILLRIDGSDYETLLARSRATVQQARAEAEHAEQELARLLELADRRLASESQMEDARRQAEVNRARLADAEANLRQAELDLDRTELKAPFNAVVQMREVEVGQYVNRAQSAAVLYGADVVEVRVPLAIRQLGYLDIPLSMRGELPPAQAPDVKLTGVYGGQEQHWQGKLVRIEAAIDANSNTVQTIIRVAQPEGSDALPLPIGLYVEAAIEGKQVNDIIALPRSVVRNNNQVLVVDAENKMFYREVDIYRLEEERVLISGGLLPGEKICVSPIQAVINGMSVQPVMESLAPSSQAAL